jgi:class 3 adenylate cyclase
MRPEVRKTVSVVFSDVAGSTALAEQLDPEPLRRAMTRYFEVARGVHERHGGVVEKFIGDAVMAVFGVPCAHEDDALRAVRAAWELRAAIAELNLALQRELEVTLSVRTGVNTGLVLATDEHDQQAFVGGDTVNVAARLERAAQPGEVLLGAATHELVAGAVRVQPVDGFAVRGRSVPVAAYRLLDLTPGADGLARRADTPLVGRTDELDLLERALARAVTGGAPELVTVLGDPGIGKTRLVRAFAERVAGRAVVLYGRCPPYGPGLADRVVAQLAAHASPAPGGDQPDGDDPGTIAADPEAAFGRLRRRLQALAADRPVVVVVEDLHWAEQPLWDLVDYLHGFAGGASLLLLATARRQFLDRAPDWTAGEAATTLTLAPLSAGASAELAAGLSGRDGLGAAVTGRVVALTEGNPLLTEELLLQATARDGGRPIGAAGGPVQPEEPTFPPVVEALVAAELDRLPPQERAVLELASVVGRVFDWASVAALADDRLRPRVGAILLALARRKLVRVAGRGPGGDEFAFRNGVLHDVAYRTVPKRHRAVLHVRVAERLDELGGEGGSRDEAVGHHLGQGYRHLAELVANEPPPPPPAARPPDRARRGVTG